MLEVIAAHRPDTEPYFRTERDKQMYRQAKQAYEQWGTM